MNNICGAGCRPIHPGSFWPLVDVSRKIMFLSEGHSGGFSFGSRRWLSILGLAGIADGAHYLGLLNSLVFADSLITWYWYILEQLETFYNVNEIRKV